jgi:hypothetical protein
MMAWFSGTKLTIKIVSFLNKPNDFLYGQGKCVHCTIKMTFTLLSNRLLRQKIPRATPEYLRQLV